MTPTTLHDAHKTPNVERDYPTLLSLIDNSVLFFNRDVQSRTFADIADCTKEANHTHQRLNILRTERPDIVRVLVMGEFKAGKSTLINALLGRSVAATDVFEMTTIVCRIIPVQSNEERVILTSRSTNLPARSMSIAEFLNYSAEQALTLRQEERATTFQYTQADLYIATDLQLEILDTPGLGATLENELNALDAINTCDVILWAVNAQNIGGARESAMLEKLQDRDQPLLCVVTKIDSLSATELDTVEDYVVDDYEVPADRLFLVSARHALDGHLDSGLNKLRTYLQTQIAPVGARLREQALLAQAKDVGVEAGLALKRIDQSLTEAITRNQEVMESFFATAEVITKDVALELSRNLRSQLKISLTSVLDKEWQHRGNSEAERRFDPAKMSQAIETAIKNVDADGIVKNLDLEGRYKGLWTGELKSEIEMLVSGLSNIEREANQEAMRVTEKLTRERISQAERKKQALESVVDTLDSIARESYSLLHFSWALVKNIPDLIARVVKLGFSAMSGSASSSIKELFSTWADETVDGLVAEKFTSKFGERNRKVAMAAANKFACEQADWAITLEQLEAVRVECRSLYSGLAAFVPLEDLPAVTTFASPSPEIQDDPSQGASRQNDEGDVANDMSGVDPIRKLKAKLNQVMGNNPSLKPDAMRVALDKLNLMVGLEGVKNDISELTDYVTVQHLRQQQGFNGSPLNLHMIFTGNPGTGKTSVARLLGEIYHAMGLLRHGRVIEVGRADLVAEYVGHTAIKVQAVVAKSLGGILFIDEAYTLVQGRGGTHDFGQEAIDTLVMLMENHREELMVIVAGYTAPMQQFVNSNPGLQSRFTRTIHFEDYSATDLTTIFEQFAHEGDYRITEDARQKLVAIFSRQLGRDSSQFGNGRFARTLFERAKIRQAKRIATLEREKRQTTEILDVLDAEDIQEQ